MEKASNSSKRTTPEPDTFAKRQRIQDAEFMKSIGDAKITAAPLVDKSEAS